jgi:two-component system NtrC family sensor kinase
MIVYELVVIKGSDKGKVFRLESDKISIGRDRSCDLHLDDKEISRKHVSIGWHAGGLTIEDLNSTNGTLVNGERVGTGCLKVDDRITLGMTELLVRQAIDHTSKGEPQLRPSIPDDETARLRQPVRHKLPSREETGLASLMSITQTLSSDMLMDLLGRSHASLEAMYRVIRMASSVFDLDLLLNKILDEVFATVRAERAFILLIDPNSDQLEIKASRWKDIEGLEHRVSISQNIIDHVLDRKESALIADAMADSQFGLAKSVVLHKIRSAMCSPLRGRTRIVGIIHVDTSTSSSEFGREDLLLLDAIGNAAGIAVENAQLYREKIHNERLAAMGQAISGLSHYIKNILAAMEVSSSLMEKGLAAEDMGTIDRVWQILRRSTQRISNLVLDMLAYSKDRKPQFQPCLLNVICKEVGELCRDRLQGKKAQLHLDLAQDLPRIQADPQGIHRCLLNLVGNAIDALGERGGEVRITTRKGDSTVIFSVEDNGTGMPDKIRERIFDVFFSTKGNQGTGLGLAVTKKIIEEHGGNIEVVSEVGQGTRFTVQLPLKEA